MTSPSPPAGPTASSRCGRAAASPPKPRPGSSPPNCWESFTRRGSPCARSTACGSHFSTADLKHATACSGRSRWPAMESRGRKPRPAFPGTELADGRTFFPPDHRPHPGDRGNHGAAGPDHPAGTRRRPQRRPICRRGRARAGNGRRARQVVSPPGPRGGGSRRSPQSRPPACSPAAKAASSRLRWARGTVTVDPFQSVSSSLLSGRGAWSTMAS